MTKELQKDFCIFIAKIITKEQLDELKIFNNNLNNNSIYVKQKIRENDFENNEKLKDYGIPKNINSGLSGKEVNQKKIIEDEFNSEIQRKCSSKFFILEMNDYNKIIDKFYTISNKESNAFEFPVVNEFNILSITTAASINATDTFIRENCDKIYNQFYERLKKKI